ncbi:MAG TPA: hypothetical protein VMD05_01675 [Candidatus Nanoarchaeia archaeon]|nr:hypothetical protein [Candidatus Nanoarchaeia archaeon]
MKTRIMKTLTILAIVGILPALALSCSPALACNTIDNGFKCITVHGQVVNNDFGFPLPLTLDIKLAGFQKALIGTGTSEDPACGTSIIVVTGSINGHTLTLSGWVIKGIDTPQLKGTKVQLIADCQSGWMTYTFGPISQGLPLSGLTFVFTGAGTVSIN